MADATKSSARTAPPRGVLLQVWVPFISTQPNEVPNVFQVETILYGALIIVFLIFEPRGLFGLWIRVRNYWKAWPFSY